MAPDHRRADVVGGRRAGRRVPPQRGLTLSPSAHVGGTSAPHTGTHAPNLRRHRRWGHQCTADVHPCPQPPTPATLRAPLPPTPAPLPPPHTPPPPPGPPT